MTSTKSKKKITNSVPEIKTETASVEQEIKDSQISDEIVQKLAAALEKVATNEDFIKRNNELYTEVYFIPTEEYKKHIDKLGADYQAMWDESPWQ